MVGIKLEWDQGEACCLQVLFGPHIAQLGILNIQVRRDHILEDALQQLQLHSQELRKPLKVTFLGGENGNIKEEGVDEGVEHFICSLYCCLSGRAGD